MKRVLCLMIVIMMFGMMPVYSQASETSGGTFSLGIVGGINFADMHFPNQQGIEDQRVTSLTGLAAGAVLEFRLSKNIFLRLEPMVMQKGGNIEEGNDPANQPEGYIKTTALELPVMIRYSFGNQIRPYLLGGPTVGYNLSSEMEFDLTGLIFKSDLKDVTGTFDMGITFGGGVQLDAGFGSIFLEGRYLMGLLNQRKSGTVLAKSNGFQFEMDSDKERDKYFSRGFQLLAGFSIPLGGR